MNTNTTPAGADATRMALIHEQIEAAAKTLAECMDYPWEPMPEMGRAAMRAHAVRVIGAALAAAQDAQVQAAPHPTAQQGEPSGWHRIEEDAEVDVPLDTDLLLAWWDEWSGAWKIEANYAGSERGGWRHGRATHWMPLPAPPSAAQQKGASNG